MTKKQTSLADGHRGTKNSFSRLLVRCADDKLVTVRCPICDHTETMSKEQADKYDLEDYELCDSCHNRIFETTIKGGKS